MAAVKDSFLDLERHRLLLEANVSKLRESLARWQLWEAEYEGLKEEITSVPQPASPKHLALLRRDFDGQVVTRKEVNEIFGRTDLRSADQILSVLTRRLDYVYKNVETLTKQVEAAENKLLAATVISQPDLRNEDGDFVADIVEELDDDDNVLSYRLQTPGETAPQVMEVLEKAGIEEFQPDKMHVATSSPVKTPSSAPELVPLKENESPPSPAATQASISASAPRPAKKGVSFADDTKPGHEGPSSASQRPIAVQRRERVMQEAEEQEASFSRLAPVIPTSESAEEAALRREMLEYSMSEIGPVVAELELEEADSDDDVEDYSDDEEDDDDDEDEHGRSKYSSLSNDYRQRMMELEARLTSGAFFTTDELNRPMTMDNEGVGRISVVDTNAESGPTGYQPTANETSEKTVKFAQNLDITSDTASTTDADTAQEADPLSDVVERTGRVEMTAEKPTRKKVSRFRMEREAASGVPSPPAQAVPEHFPPKGPQDAPPRFLNTDLRETPSGPEGQTIADSIVERDSIPATDTDQLEANLLHQQMATQYHEMRNRFIKRDGGFLKEDQSAIKPVEEEEGGPKRMSKFKAARLSKH